MNAADHIVRVRNLESQAAQHNDAISFPVMIVVFKIMDDFVRRYHVFVCLAVSRCQQVTSVVVQTASGIISSNPTAKSEVF